MMNDWSYMEFDYWVGVARELGLETLLAAFPNFSEQEQHVLAQRLNGQAA